MSCLLTPSHGGLIIGFTGYTRYVVFRNVHYFTDATNRVSNDGVCKSSEGLKGRWFMRRPVYIAGHFRFWRCYELVCFVVLIMQMQVQVNIVTCRYVFEYVACVCRASDFWRSEWYEMENTVCKEKTGSDGKYVVRYKRIARILPQNSSLCWCTEGLNFRQLIPILCKIDVLLSLRILRIDN